MQKKMPRVAFVFADLSYGGSNLQTVKIIQRSGAADNCIVISLFDTEDDTTIEKNLLDIGVKPIHLHFKKRRLLLELRRLKCVVKENCCQLVNSNGLRSDVICHYAFQVTGIKHIITLHNYLREDAFLRMSRPKAYLATILQTHVLRRSKYVITCSKTLQEKTMRDIKELQVTAIQNGVDLAEYPIMDKIELRRKYGFPEKDLVFISTGSMTLRKRIPETVDAFIRAGLSNAMLVMVGSGPYLDEYKARYSSNGNVTFLGRRNDIKELLNVADVFVSSSESEGLPLAVLEALSTQNYVYLSDIPQHEEILREFPNSGKLYRLGNDDELTELFKNTEEIVLNAEPATVRNSKFDIEVMGKAYWNYYTTM